MFLSIILLSFNNLHAEGEAPTVEECEDFKGEVPAEIMQQIISGTFEGELPIEELRASRRRDTVTSTKEVTLKEATDGESSFEECHVIHPIDPTVHEAVIRDLSYAESKKSGSVGIFKEIVRGTRSIGSANPVPLSMPAHISVGGGLSTPLTATTAAPALIQKILKERFGIIQPQEQPAWPRATDLLAF
jgi:hypothetical protein